MRDFLRLKKFWEMEKIGKSPWLNSAIVNYYRADAMLCADWLVSITYFIFWDFIGLGKLSYIF